VLSLVRLLGELGEARLAAHRVEHRIGEELDDVLVEEGGDDRDDDDGQQGLREPVA
jgi:hypothetical protein